MSGTKSALKKDTPEGKKKAGALHFADKDDAGDKKDAKPETEAKGPNNQEVSTFVDKIMKSVSPKVMSVVKDWKVGSAAITKAAMPPENPANAGQPARRVSKLSRMGTSKIHNFKPAVSITEACGWLASYGNADSNLIFTNQCMLAFTQGVFTEFEDLRDEDDAGGGAADPDKRPADSDDEENGTDV